MTVNVYYSTDASAPVLSGTAGALTALLDACLVNGYGAKAGAGWGKAFSATNKAVYRAASGNRHFYRVDDTGTTGGRLRGFETMSDVDTGTGPFPTDVQVSGGGFVFKSAAANTTAVPWVLIVSSTMCYLIVQTAAAFAGGAGHAFGEITSFKAADAYGSLVVCAIAAPTAANGHFGSFITNVFNTEQGHFLARSYTQVSGAVGASKCADYLRGSANNTYPYPDPVTGGILLTPAYILEPVSFVTRGVLPGVWAHLHGLNNPAVGPILGTFDGTGDLAGRTFLFLPSFAASTGQTTRLVFEISDTW